MNFTALKKYAGNNIKKAQKETVMLLLIDVKIFLGTYFIKKINVITLKIIPIKRFTNFIFMDNSQK